jgi:hypothetical protein
MKRLPIAIALGLALMAAGCRSNGGQELLERDLRWQEDRIRHLESHICECEQQLEACQQENADLKRQLVSGVSIPALSPSSTPRRKARALEEPTSPNDFTPPSVQLPGAEQAPPFQGPPQISPPNPAVPEGEMPPDKRPTSNSGTSAEPPGAPQIELPAPTGPALEPRLIPSADGGDPSRVTKITLNAAQTKGYNADDLPGDEGVSVTVEPRDASGALLRAAGKLSIVVLDPTLAGDAARVARWNFTEEDAAAHHRSGTDALRFDLRWPERLPQNPNLKLFVRFTRADGQKFDAERDLRIAVPPRTAADWTRSKQPAPPKTVPIETTPIAPAAPPSGGGSDPPSSQPAATSGDRTVRRSGVQWTPYR